MMMNIVHSSPEPQSFQNWLDSKKETISLLKYESAEVQIRSLKCIANEAVTEFRHSQNPLYLKFIGGCCDVMRITILDLEDEKEIQLQKDSLEQWGKSLVYLYKEFFEKED